VREPSPRPRPGPPVAAAQPAGARRALPAAFLVLALAGVAIAADLWVIHQRARAGAGPSFCDIDEHVSCGKVALSRFSVLLGVPLAAWGGLSYLALAALAALALRRGRTAPEGPAWPAGLLFLGSAFMTAGAAVLAAISTLAIDAFCIVCSASWAVSLALLVLSLFLVRPAGGPVPAVRADLQALRARPAMAAWAGGALLILAAGLIAWQRLAPATPKVPPLAGPAVVYEYSDYLCPHCARMHGTEKSVTAAFPGVRFVRRQFPLDAACNPRVKTTIPGHEGSCELARGGICAERLGAFEAYDDAAFAQQDAHPSAETLAQATGLDPSAFRDCLASPETAARLAGEIRDGIAAGVKATPSYQLRGKVYSGTLPPELGGSPAP
jgi:uncharacterized membrane protein/2-hydroxychromene-2-carboxylate isomerase